MLGESPCINGVIHQTRNLQGDTSVPLTRTITLYYNVVEYVF